MEHPRRRRAGRDSLALGLHLAFGTFGLLGTRRFRRRFFDQWRRQVGAAREQLRVRDELALARQVQLSMLPAAVPQLPRLDLAAACLPATEVGGDYYDFFEAEDGLRWWSPTSPATASPAASCSPP